MYQTIYVPVDNSEYSNRAIDQAVRLGEKFGAKLVGCHVYAARMHDYRFKQMEFTLPGEYLLEEEIERQRRIHDSLITMGLELISDSYLDTLGRKCDAAGLVHERKMMDGKHHVQLLEDMRSSAYDLTVIGAMGVGKTKDSIIGSVCENVARHAQKDLLVIKHLPKEGETEADTILVGVDGSPQSFGAVITALELARKFKKKVELIGVYDPYLHYAVFNNIVDVLSEKAAKVFRFEEQNQLHEEIIDCGLAQIYQSHLNVAEKMGQACCAAFAREKAVSQAGAMQGKLGAAVNANCVQGNGVQENGAHDATRIEARLAEAVQVTEIEITKTLLDGKAFQKILSRAREIRPWLLIVGRIGVHSAQDAGGLGSNTENLLRLAPCDVLLSTRIEHPEIDLKASETILWTPEAEQRMHRVPSIVRGIARTGILRLALEHGHSVVTNAVIDEAMERFMPRYTAKATTQLAGRLVLEHARSNPVSMCKKCGVTASVSDAKRCAVCGGTEFDVLTPEVIEKIVSEEGGGEEEETFDGKKLRWSKDARDQLLAIEDKYQKRRAKARIEKVARMKKLDTITLEFASAVIMDEVGQVLFDVQPKRAENGNGSSPAAFGLLTHDLEDDKMLIGTDEKGNTLRSVFTWEDAAVHRFFRIPPGFMRERVQQRIEELALAGGVERIAIDAVERAIDHGKATMVETLLSSEQLTAEQRELLEGFKAKGASALEQKDGQCPFSALFSQEKSAVAVEKTSIQASDERQKPQSNVYKGVVAQVLNEVGIMSELQKSRERLKT